MIYDCFIFFNELDLLEIRLHVLNAVVDKFVLVEASKTFTGKEKPLYFEENRPRFSDFLDKIIHVVVDDFPPFIPNDPASTWIYENHQRNAIVRGLHDIRPQDIVLFSDTDEIPNPDTIKRHMQTPGIKCLEQMPFNYFINYLCVTSGPWRVGTKMMSYYDFLHCYDDYKVKFNIFVPSSMNQGATVNRIRHLTNAVIIKDGGWHFSFLGGVPAIVKKIQSFAHFELNNPAILSPEEITRRIQSGEGIYRRSERSFAIPVDDRFPEYIRKNKEKFAHLIFDVTPLYLKRTRFKRIFFTCVGSAIRIIEGNLIPAWLHWKMARILVYLRATRIR